MPNTKQPEQNKTISEGKNKQQGWECPKCGSVYAIWVSECKRCINSNIVFKISTKGTDEQTK